MWAYQKLEGRSGRRAGILGWVIGAVLLAAVAQIGLCCWFQGSNSSWSEGGYSESLTAPEVDLEPTAVFNVTEVSAPAAETGESVSLMQFLPQYTGSKMESADGSTSERLPVTALAQRNGNGGPANFGQQASGNRPGGNQPGGGNQLPGGSGMFSGGGQGAGGVCIETKIQFRADATASLADRHDNAVWQRPTPGRFFSD